MPRHTRLRRLLGEDRGSVSLETAMVFAVFVIAIICITFHLWVWYYVRGVALTAAQQGLAAARSETATADAGQTAADQVITTQVQSLGWLTGATVAVDRSEEVTSVTVTGDAKAIWPSLPIHVAQTATGPTERLTAPDGSTGSAAGGGTINDTGIGVVP